MGEYHTVLGFPGGSAGKESTCNIGEPGSIPGLGSSPGQGIGYPPRAAAFVPVSIVSFRSYPGSLK